ncbi:MAG: AbrB/MazE/SpoVT family DNA-binding domain-containing protein [Planctomycetes bacterium]|jgi:antitoxin MazE|nr:AbrB/MazE/SpoVT family DNA-binding domain-containing protein [Planctomycetota bacterium]
MRTRIVKWGNSLGLRIPKAFAEEVQVGEGSVVELSLEDGRLVIRVATVSEYALEELVRGISSRNLHREIDTGEPVGGEAW